MYAQIKSVTAALAASCLVMTGPLSAQTLTVNEGSAELKTGKSFQPINGSIAAHPGDRVRIGHEGHVTVFYDKDCVIWLAGDRQAKIPTREQACSKAGGGFGGGTALLGLLALGGAAGVAAGMKGSKPASP